jgi:uncharacterized protein YabN with tetrapyrrole methylase and pyrophosphatase domain
MGKGSLSVVGIGYQIASHTTPEASAQIKKADKFFYLADVGKERTDTYEEMVERMLAPVRKGVHVCVAFYGHPGVCAYPTHEAVRRARKEGYKAKMFPSISSTDCLFADLGIDPADGCQVFEATDFLVRKRKLDTSVGILLWQINGIAISTYYSDGHAAWNMEGVRVLSEVLQKAYSPRHKVVVYEASVYPVCDPSIQTVPLSRLHKARISSASMLYVPPKDDAPYDYKMLTRLRMK